MTDEIIREVRRVRHEISRRCDHDPRRVVAYYREFQEQLKRSGNYRFRQVTAETNETAEDQCNVEGTAGIKASHRSGQRSAEFRSLTLIQAGPAARWT